MNRRIETFYRSLLRLYPASFCEEYGDQMIRTLKDWHNDAIQTGGVGHLIIMWSRAFWDLVLNLPFAWFDHFKKGQITMTAVAPIALSFVLPIYNEERRIASLVQRIATIADGLNLAWELVIVDDQSQDASLKTIEALANEHVRVLRLPGNVGYNQAVQHGVRNAESADIIVLSPEVEDNPRDLKIALNSTPVMQVDFEHWSLMRLIQVFQAGLRHGWARRRRAYRVQRLTT